MKIKSFGVAAQCGPSLPLLNGVGTASLHTCLYPPHLTLQTLSVPSPLMLSAHWSSRTSFTACLVTTWPSKRVFLLWWQLDLLCLPKAPCASSSWPLLQASWHSPFHEMAHFANTLLLSGPSPHGVYLLCFPRWYLCFPYGSLLSLLFRQVSQGLLFQENAAAALGKLVFLSTYSL